MSIKMRKSDTEFIKKNMGEDSILLKTDDLREFSLVFTEWIARNGFDETGENYSDLGREAQRVYNYFLSKYLYEKFE